MAGANHLSEHFIEQTVRIIGGRWRGRPVRFASNVTVRPTPNRVRETLFNWLRDAVREACCLDLFAGSGALGLEALSRGAAHCVFVEHSRSSARAIREHLIHFGAQSDVVDADALGWLANSPRPADQSFDIVFLDPPFGTDLLSRATAALAGSGRLRAGAHIYLEAEKSVGMPRLPQGWELLKSKAAGEVGYHLAKVCPA